MRLLWVIRDILGFTGAKYGCGINVCKACTSHINGRAFNPCSVRVCDIAGGNLSSAQITLHATGVTRTSSNTPATLEDSGNANPDFDFRYDAALGGYIFNLSTRGFAAGSYVLTYSISGDPTSHAAAFAVR